MPTSPITRRDFCRDSALLLFAGALPALAGCGAGDIASTPIDPSHLNVRRFGATGDGRTDDTDAFQATVDALPSGGGTVEVPAGLYRIDAVRSVRLRSGVTLDMTSGATLAARPNAATNSAVIAVYGCTGVRVLGGVIVGERTLHLGTAGEWGMGISIRGSSDILVQGVTIRECWGDGIYVGAAGNPSVGCRTIQIISCVSDGNRRQGLSIVSCTGAVVEDSVFSNTHGTAPAAGIDLEPNGRQTVSAVRIRNCRMEGNAGHGLLLWGGFGVLTANSVVGCELTGNGEAGISVNISNANSFLTNTCSANGAEGLLLNRCNRNEVRGNSIVQNSRSARGRHDNLTVMNDSSANEVIENVCRADASSDLPWARYGLSVATADCTDNHVAHNRLRRSGGSADLVDRGTRSVMDDNDVS